MCVFCSPDLIGLNPGLGASSKDRTSEHRGQHRILRPAFLFLIDRQVETHSLHDLVKMRPPGCVASSSPTGAVGCPPRSRDPERFLCVGTPTLRPSVHDGMSRWIGPEKQGRPCEDFLCFGSCSQRFYLQPCYGTDSAVAFYLIYFCDYHFKAQEVD